MVDPKIITHPHGDRTFTSTLYYGADVRESLKTLPDQSVQCAVTSPPYFGLRSYLGEGDPLKGSEIGSEPTPEEYVNGMVEVFREVKRVLRDDGVLWLNLGDSYAREGSDNYQSGPNALVPNTRNGITRRMSKPPLGLKPKDLLMIPARVALALQADGWYLRSDIIWAKGSCMPESVTDRPTRSHEYVFLLTKNARYFYDAEAVREPLKDDTLKDLERHGGERGKRERNVGGRNDGYTVARGTVGNAAGRNRRTVWTINPKPYRGSHFATMPPALAEVCIKAGTRPGDTVLDPFSGSGTTGYVANRLGRHYVGTDLNLDYLPLAEARLTGMDPPETDDATATEEGGPSSILDLLGA